MEKISEVEQYISLMVYLVRADGLVDDEEISGLLGLLEKRLEAPLDPEQAHALSARLSAEGASQATDDQLLTAGQGIGAQTLSHLVRDAYALAASDGEIHSSEIKTVRRYLRLIGIPMDRFADIDLWARSSTPNLALGLELLSPPNGQPEPPQPSTQRPDEPVSP